MNQILAHILRCAVANSAERPLTDRVGPTPPHDGGLRMLLLLRSDTAGILRELTAEGRHD